MIPECRTAQINRGKISLATLFSLFFCLCSIIAISGDVSWCAEGVSSRGTILLEDYYSSASPTSGIQEAVDALPPEGGIVILPPGSFLLRQSINLKDNVTLRGSGPSTILKKCPGFETRLLETGREGSMQIVVENRDGFEPGMQIYVKSKEWGGWYASQPVIIGYSGSTLFLSDSLEKEYDIETTVVVNNFPALWIQSRTNILIENITIDGDAAHHDGEVQDFVTAAIHSVGSRNITVRGCIIRGWPSDGIGIQGGSDAMVAECRVFDCRGHGFHPGTSIRNAIFTDIIARGNAWDGLYCCADVMNISVCGGIFNGNGWHGIGGLGGGRWPDANNIVSNNICEGNGRCGIEGTEGSNFLITGNICRNNSQKSSGEYPGILLEKCARMLVTGNLLYDDRADEKKTQKCGIEEIESTGENIITANNSWGNKISDIILSGIGK